MICAIHNIDEPDLYLRCFECKHAYTEAELIKAVQDTLKELGLDYTKIKTVDDIFYCPLCLHDF